MFLSLLDLLTLALAVLLLFWLDLDIQNDLKPEPKRFPLWRPQARDVYAPPRK